MNPMNPMGPQNPYAQPPQFQGPPANPYDYEFDAAENAAISSAALWARILGVALIVVGAAGLMNCNIVTFALNLTIGIYLLGGASALGAVVKTEGNDITYMMQGFRSSGRRSRSA